ncbi:hypothetical protein D8Y23_08885 [Microbacterium enclense]|uniref:Recombinase family protein n=1 Tax=Microbacterium enclense TaxID=993073 RepID=A0A3S3MY22_9MICO|nr:hypothetical protein D8Y23_08885 [Microbacterium enclense]
MGRISSANPRGSVVTSPGHAAIYTRISDDPEGSALGVARQEQDCRDLAARLGVRVVEVFTDNNVSASTNSTKDRPAYDELLRRARAGEFSHVLAYSNSRLTRRLRETIDLIDLARHNGVVIKTVASGEFDLSTADGRATALTLATWDQAEAERVGERVKRAATQRVESGRWHGGVPPFGFGKENKTLVVNDREASLISEAASRVLDQDETLYSIVKDWNARGDLTRKGSSWKHSVIRNVLNNPALVGTNSAGVENCWTPILDRQTFERLTERLAPDSARRTNLLGVKSSKHALGGGLVVCARCEKPLYPVARQGVRTKLVCRAFANGDHESHPKRDNGSSEGRVSIDASALETYLFERCLAHLDDDAFWDDIKRKRETADSDRARLRAERDARQGERDRAARAFIAGIMSERDAQSEVARLDSEITRLSEQIDRAHGGPTARDVWHERREVLDRFKDWTASERRLFFRALIERVSVGDWPSGLPTTTLPRKNEAPRAFEDRRAALTSEAMRQRVSIEWSD